VVVATNHPEASGVNFAPFVHHAAPTTAYENQFLFTEIHSPAASVVICAIQIVLSVAAEHISTIFLVEYCFTALYRVVIAALQLNDGVLSLWIASLLIR